MQAGLRKFGEVELVISPLTLLMQFDGQFVLIHSLTLMRTHNGLREKGIFVRVGSR